MTIVICTSALLVLGLTLYSGFGELLMYSIGSKMAVITPINLMMGIKMN